MEAVKEEGSGKLRVYTGQLITSENYNKFTQTERLFWQKAYKAFRAGNFYFKHKNQEFIVPFRLKDGSFDSVVTKEVADTQFNIKQKLKENDDIREAGQSESVDKVVGDTL